ncbi:MAG: phosphohistidine phosphatase SixA [Chthoniobacterales bacterium]
MILYLLRHAEAGLKTKHGDSKRALTEVGKQQAMRMGAFFQKHQIQLELVLTSPFCRAVKTMEAFFETSLTVPFLEVPWMASGMSSETALKELQAYKKLESVMLVGHEPDFSHLIATMLGMTHAENVNVPKASLTAIQLEKIASGTGVLQFLIPVELVDEKFLAS